MFTARAEDWVLLLVIALPWQSRYTPDLPEKTMQVVPLLRAFLARRTLSPYDADCITALQSEQVSQLRFTALTPRIMVVNKRSAR